MKSKSINISGDQILDLSRAHHMNYDLKAVASSSSTAPTIAAAVAAATAI